MEVVEDFESRPHKAVPFVVDREKEMQEWYEQKLPKVLPGYSGARLSGKSTKEKDSEEGEVAGIKEKASAHDDVMATAQRAAVQSVKQNGDCSQVENEEEEEEEDWHKEDQMEA